MKQGWSCPSWHGSREQTQSGGTVRSSAKPSRDGRTCYRCLGWCGMREGGICSQCEPGFWSGFIPVKLICSSLWPDLIRRVRFLTSVFFFFFLWSIEFTSAQISKRPWLVFSTRLWILFPLDTHSMSDLGFVWITPAASRAEPWAWAPLIHSECHFEPFPNVISPKVNHKVKECALASDTMPDKYFQQATAKETQVWSCS